MKNESVKLNLFQKSITKIISMVANECSPLFVKINRKRNNGNVIKECILSLLLDVNKANSN